MVKAKTEYVRDPADGLPARRVRRWARRKHHYLDRYLSIFARTMETKWRTRTFVDLFAGPGRCEERETGEFYDGSPLIAGRYAFTDHIYVELDPIAAEALEQRTATLAATRRVSVIQGDCNLAIDRVIERLPRGGLTLAFLDPTTWQVSLETVRRLTEHRPVDLIVTFMGGLMKRVEMGTPQLDAFFGTTAYRDDTRYLGVDGKPTLSGLLGCYREQLVSQLGYRDALAAREVIIRTPTNTPLYLMAFFSKHPLGHRFWDEITVTDERGQTVLAFR